VLACNTDAHAKNFAIMIRGGGASLAPMYDVMCGEAWDTVTKSLAQQIADERRADRLAGRHWQQFARACALNPKQILARVEALARAAAAEAEAAAAEVAAMPGGPHERLERTRQAVERRAAAILAQLQEPDDREAPKAIMPDDTHAAREAVVAGSQPA
jgi:serine/threonine-protein kinase HipA